MNWANQLWRPFRQQKQRRLGEMYATQPTWYCTYWQSDRRTLEHPAKKLGPLMMAATSFCGPRQWLVQQWLVSSEKKRSYPILTAWPDRSEERIPKKKPKIEKVDEGATFDKEEKYTNAFGTQNREGKLEHATETTRCNELSPNESSSKENATKEDSAKENTPKECVVTQQKTQRRKLVRRPPAKPDKPTQRKRRFTRTTSPQLVVTEDVCKMVRLLRYEADLNKGDFFEALKI